MGPRFACSWNPRPRAFPKGRKSRPADRWPSELPSRSPGGWLCRPATEDSPPPAHRALAPNARPAAPAAWASSCRGLRPLGVTSLGQNGPDGQSQVPCQGDLSQAYGHPTYPVATVRATPTGAGSRGNVNRRAGNSSKPAKSHPLSIVTAPTLNTSARKCPCPSGPPPRPQHWFRLVPAPSDWDSPAALLSLGLGEACPAGATVPAWPGAPQHHPPASPGIPPVTATSPTPRRAWPGQEQKERVTCPPRLCRCGVGSRPWARDTGRAGLFYCHGGKTRLTDESRDRPRCVQVCGTQHGQSGRRPLHLPHRATPAPRPWLPPFLPL